MTDDTDDADAATPLHPLNPFSTKFDPSLALRAAPEDVQAQLPTARDRHMFRKAGPLNNVAACASLSSAPFRVLTAAAVRRPAPTLAVENVAKRRKRPRSEDAVVGDMAPRFGVLEQMHRRQADRSGPLSMLERAVRQRRRVRIVVRERHAIRGAVTGVVVAFDMHFNLVLGKAVIRDIGERPRVSKVLFLRGENVVLVALQ